MTKRSSEPEASGPQPATRDLVFPSRPVALALALVVGGWLFNSAVAAEITESGLQNQFKAKILPFIDDFCSDCHDDDKPKGDLDLTAYTTMESVARDFQRWDQVLEKLQAAEMPPKKARFKPEPAVRQQIIDWIKADRRFEAVKHAGDPGIVLARRLSNEEYNYTIRDLTGVDMQPTREFPEDPSNTAGFDNSGESLVMSPSLLKKYLAAAREVSDHLYLKENGLAFAPHSMIAETDRDQFCVMQIINFYRQQNTNYDDYFQAAWRFKHRAALGHPNATLADVAGQSQVSGKYLATIFDVLENRPEAVGPMVKLRSLWQALPAPDAARPDIALPGCEAMRDYVIQLRKKVEMRFFSITAGKIGIDRQPMMIWRNIQYATHRRDFDRAQLQVAGEPPAVREVDPEPGAKYEFGPGRTILITNVPGDVELVVPAGKRQEFEAAFGRFCSVFPDMFYMAERGRDYFDRTTDRGRYLSAGFHNLMGYFRDDEPLYELILDADQQKRLDELWREMDFVASVNIRTYTQFYLEGNSEGRVIAEEKLPKDQPPEDRGITSEARIKLLEDKYLEDARGGSEVGIQAIRDFFKNYNDSVRWVEKARIDAEPGDLETLLKFAARAYRRPLTQAEKEDLLAYYHSARDKDGLDQVSAMRESIVAVLMSPDMTYRVDLVGDGDGIRPLTDYDLASRLSYFLWSSIPDDELLSHAAAGDLHQPSVIAAQARRMLRDPRARALAVEFGGNWLDFRRFEGIATVDLQRFPEFTPALREAMFEEPVHFLMDVFQHNRSILDLVYADDTFVNPVLARHYGMPVANDEPDRWIDVKDAGQFGRGGLLPMAVFLTKNAPGLRTSPVKRGNWVVKNVLGERIPAPPPNVPQLPQDEAKLDLPLRDMLARHRSDPNCAACHARFDSMGLVFEGYGPVGDRRTKDLAGRPIDARATFPGGSEGTGLEGLKKYIHNHRQNDFVDNFCGKLLVYALGRSLIPSDDLLIEEMHRRLAADGYRFDNMIETIVTSPQFLTKRGGHNLAER